MTLYIARPLLESIEESALRSMPEECCGLLVGRVDGDRRWVERVRAARNVWDGDRSRRYEIDPQTVFNTMRDARRAGLDVVGFYHSHPDGSREPSAHDLETAWPGKSYVIVTVAADRVVCIRSWRLASGGSPLGAGGSPGVRMVEEPIN